MAYKVELDFGAGYVDYSDYLYLATPTDKPVKRKRAIYNNFKPVIGTCQIQFVRNTTLVNAFLTASEAIECKITNGVTPYFQGYIRPTFKAQLTAQYGLTALTVEAVDSWYRLDKTAITNAVYLSTQVSKPSDPSTSLLHLLFTTAGFTAGEINLPEITANVPALNVQAYSDKYRDIIEGILEECGYSAYVDASGVIQLYNLGPSSITPSVTMATGHGGNIAEQLNIERQEAAKEAVDVEYSDAKIIAGAKVFEDTTGGNGSNPCNISLDPGEYYPEGAASGKSVKGKMGIDGQELIAVYGLTSTINASGVVTEEFVQSGMDISIRLYSSGGGTITTLAGYGNAVVAGDVKKVIREFVVNTEKRETYTMKYLRDETSAQRLAIIRARRYQYGSFVWSMKTTQLDLEPGDYVAIDESAILGATSTLRVISVEDSQDPKTITISAEGVAAYEADATSTYSEFVTQDPLSAEQEAQVTTIVSGVLITESGQAPANVLTLTAKAYQDYIQLTWPEPSGNTLSSNPVGYILQRSVDGGATWKDVSGVTDGLYRVQGSVYNWQFARVSDGYPEKTENKGWTPLSSYRFRVKAVNAAGVASAGWAAASSVDATDYKGWMPTAPSPSGRTAMRTASLSWAEELAAYGRLRFEVQISNDNIAWYQPASGLDVYASEDNWRQSATADLFNEVSMPAWTQALPLSGQTADNPVDTTYYYRVRTVLDCPWTGSEGVGASSSGKRASAWSSAVTVLAKANGAYDLVAGAVTSAAIALGAVTADKISVENLAAIQGLFASIAGGGDDELNYWNLSAVPQGSRPVGSFRAGNATVYLFANPGAAGTLADPYIALVAGSDYIKLTSTGVVMSDTLMAKVGASSATIDAIFTSQIEVTDGVLTFYDGEGAARKYMRLEKGHISIGNAPEGGDETELAYLGINSGAITPVITNYSAFVGSKNISSASIGTFTHRCSAEYAGKIYYPQNGGTTLEIYDIATGSTVTKTLPNSMNRWACLVYKSKLYMPEFSGDKLEIYDIDSDTSSTVTLLNSMQHLFVVIYKDILYMPGNNTNKMESYNTMTGQKSTITLLSTLYRFAGAISGESIYIPAGDGSPILEVYNINTGVVEEKVLPNAVSRYACAAYNSKVYIAENQAIIRVFDTKTESLTNITMPNNMSKYACAIDNGKIYFPGYNTNKLEIYSFIDGSIEVVTLATSEERYACNIYNGSIFMPRGGGATLDIYEIAKLCRIGAGIIESGVAPDGSRWQITSDGMLECWGWGYITWVSGNQNVPGSITFPAEFDEAPDVVVTTLGEKSTNPASRAELTRDGSIWFTANSPTTTGTSFRGNYITGLASTTRVGYSWRAKGRAAV